MTRQQKTVIGGAILGAAVGAMGGFLFSRSLDESGRSTQQVSLRSLPTGEVVRLVFSILAMLRSVAEMGEKV